MYATSEIALKKYGFPDVCKEEGAPADAKPVQPGGTIFSIDVATAVTNPAAAVKGKVAAECSPVRLSMTPDGASAWVSNRGSNTASLFDLAQVDASNNAALVTSVAVGSNPVAIAVTRDGRYVLVGNTNRFGTGGTNAGSISVIDAQTHHVVGTMKAGLFPRQFSQGIGTTLFLANNRSDTVTVIDESRLKF
jgi:DNA-binding beta-propeller fold protein YncE